MRSCGAADKRVLSDTGVVCLTAGAALQRQAHRTGALSGSGRIALQRRVVLCHVCATPSRPTMCEGRERSVTPGVSPVFGRIERGTPAGGDPRAGAQFAVEY